MQDTLLARHYSRSANGYGESNTVRRVLPYVDLPMFIETTPDDNDACWIYMQAFAPYIEGAGRITERQFDITESDARAIIAALTEYLARLELYKEENHAAA